VGAAESRALTIGSVALPIRAKAAPVQQVLHNWDGRGAHHLLRFQGDLAAPRAKALPKRNHCSNSHKLTPIE
jgi:hypothetical protein